MVGLPVGLGRCLSSRVAAAVGLGLPGPPVGLGRPGLPLSSFQTS